jgi:hypothetical protein
MKKTKEFYAFNKHWRVVWGLGIAGETCSCVSDDFKRRCTVLSAKLFIGPLMLTFMFPVTRIKPNTD